MGKFGDGGKGNLGRFQDGAPLLLHSAVHRIEVERAQASPTAPSPCSGFLLIRPSDAATLPRATLARPVKRIGVRFSRGVPVTLTCCFATPPIWDIHRTSAVSTPKIQPLPSGVQQKLFRNISGAQSGDPTHSRPRLCRPPQPDRPAGLDSSAAANTPVRS